MKRRPFLDRARLAYALLREHEAEEAREGVYRSEGGYEAAQRFIRDFAARIEGEPRGSGADRWRRAAERYAARFYPEPPRNSGEADAVHGPTALGTHHELEGHASSTAGRRRTGTSSSADDNTPDRSSANPDARP